MNVCCICQGDGVVMIGPVWYCREHSFDGLIDMAHRVGGWLAPGRGEFVWGRTIDAFEDAGFAIPARTGSPPYYCYNCEGERWYLGECVQCGDMTGIPEDDDD